MEGSYLNTSGPPMRLINLTESFQNLSCRTEDNYLVGCTICIMCAFGLCGYVPVLLIMQISPVLDHPCYRFMVSLGVTDSVSLLFWFVCGLYTISNGTLIPQEVMDWLMTAVEFGWFSLVCHVAVISFNRYLAICRPDFHIMWFQTNFTATHWIVLTWSEALLFNFLTYLPPGPAFNLDGWQFTWKDSGVVEFYRYFDQGLCSIVFVLMILEYSMIIKRYRESRQNVLRHSERERSDTNGARKKQSREMKRQCNLALQCFVFGLSFWLSDVLFYAAPIVFRGDCIAIFLCSTGSWIFNNAMNPWLYLAFNRSLRSEFRRLIKKMFPKWAKRDSRPVSVTSMEKA